MVLGDSGYRFVYEFSVFFTVGEKVISCGYLGKLVVFCKYVY